MAGLWVEALAAGLALVGLLLLFVALRRLARGKLVSAAGSSLVAALFVATGALALVAGLNLRTYSRLTYEQPVAELRFAPLAPQRWRATLIRADTGEQLGFDLAGDEWQLDARILKWHAIANLLGFDALYRLERLSGRYVEIEQERTQPRTVHALADNPGIDLFELSRVNARWLPFVDASYGSGAYLPMAPDTRFQVTLGQAGLIARALGGEVWPR